MDWNPTTQRFVGDKRLQLGETPAMERCALRPSSPHPRADVRQAERATLPRHLTDVVTGRVRCCKRAQQRIRLRGRGQQFQLDGQFHVAIVSRIERMCKYPLKRAKAERSSHGLSCWASAPEGTPS